MMRTRVRVLGLALLCSYSSVDLLGAEPGQSWNLLPGKLFGTSSTHQAGVVQTESAPSRQLAKPRTATAVPAKPTGTTAENLGKKRTTNRHQMIPPTWSGTREVAPDPPVTPAFGPGPGRRKSWATTPRPLYREPFVPARSPSLPQDNRSLAQVPVATRPSLGTSITGSPPAAQPQTVPKTTLQSADESPSTHPSSTAQPVPVFRIEDNPTPPQTISPSAPVTLADRGEPLAAETEATSPAAVRNPATAAPTTISKSPQTISPSAPVTLADSGKPLAAEAEAMSPAAVRYPATEAPTTVPKTTVWTRLGLKKPAWPIGSTAKRSTPTPQPTPKPTSTSKTVSTEVASLDTHAPEPTLAGPLSSEPASSAPTSARPISSEPTLSRPTSSERTSSKLTSSELTSSELTSSEPTSSGSTLFETTLPEMTPQVPASSATASRSPASQDEPALARNQTPGDQPTATSPPVNSLEPQTAASVSQSDKQLSDKQLSASKPLHRIPAFNSLFSAANSRRASADSAPVNQASASSASFELKKRVSPTTVLPSDGAPASFSTVQNQVPSQRSVTNQVASNSAPVNSIRLETAPEPPALHEAWLTRPAPTKPIDAMPSPLGETSTNALTDERSQLQHLLLATDLRNPVRTGRFVALAGTKPFIDQSAPQKIAEVAAPAPQQSDPLDLLGPDQAAGPTNHLPMPATAGRVSPSGSLLATSVPQLGSVPLAGFASSSLPTEPTQPTEPAELLNPFPATKPFLPFGPVQPFEANELVSADMLPVVPVPVDTIPAATASAIAVAAETSPVETSPVETSPVERSLVETIPPGSNAAHAFPAASIPVSSVPSDAGPAEARPATLVTALSATEATASTIMADVDATNSREDQPGANLDGSAPPSVSSLPPVLIELQGLIIDLTADESQFIFHAVGGQRFEVGDEVHILADALQRRSQKAQARVTEVQEDFFIGELIGVVPGTKPLEVGDTVIGRREQKD